MKPTRVTRRPRASRYLGNTDPNQREVHDLRNEMAGCWIDSVVKMGHAVIFTPDTLEEAHAEGYADCRWCLAATG
jgi:hypothetical protein